MARILIVDDEEKIRSIIRKYAEHEGYEAVSYTHLGMIGITVSTGSPTMAPWGGAERMIGNNPLAVAVPVKDGEPILLDMAMSVVAFGTVSYTHLDVYKRQMRERSLRRCRRKK